MTPSAAATLVTLTAVYLMMFGEQLLSSSNERALRARGAHEPAGDVYPLMRWAYPAGFALMAGEGLVSGEFSRLQAMIGLGLFGLAKALKFWAIAALGIRWSYRVLVLPGAPLVSKGPYRHVRHPNYLAVVGEIVGVAILLDAPVAGGLFLIGFGALMRRRIRFEERALGISGDS